MAQSQYLAKCVVNVPARKFTLLSDTAEVKEVNCETADEFERVLDVVRSSCQTDEVQYVY
jgi:hypothetical protein